MISKHGKNDGLVYSTAFGKACPKCGRPDSQCVCAKAKALAPSDGIVRIARETKGRKGAGVSIVTGAPLDQDGLKNLARLLKQKCGTGGTVKAGVIEIQGDHRDVLQRELVKLGYKVKLAGG